MSVGPDMKVVVVVGLLFALALDEDDGVALTESVLLKIVSTISTGVDLSMSWAGESFSDVHGSSWSWSSHIYRCEDRLWTTTRV